MICPKCGRRTYKNEIVCPKCGADMIGAQPQNTYIPRVQVKKIAEKPAEQSQPSPPQTPVYTPPEPVYIPEPEPKPQPRPEPKPEPKPQPAPEPEPKKEDLDRTLTFAAIKESAMVETAAVREYNRMKAQLRESKASEDGSKVMLERLPEGYVYVKMSIDEADRLNKRKNIPKPLLFGVAGAGAITIILIILLLIITGGKSTPLIAGKWQGEIEPLRFGITGIPFTKVETVWEFGKNGEVTVSPQDSLLSGYVLSGTYELSEKDGSSIASLELEFEGQNIEIEIIYSVNKSDKTMIISNRESPSYTYTLEKLK